MTQIEEEEFKQKIIETILPIARNMTETQIKSIIDMVEKENPQLPDGFGVMLYEQLIINKYKNN